MAVLGAVAIGAIVAWPSLWTAVDDAFVSARYADHLVAGHGWTYNAAFPPVEGFSNPLWTAFVALGLALGSEAHSWMVVWGLVGWLVAIPGAWLFARELQDDDGALVTPWLLACSPLLAVAATNGLETAWYLAAIAWTGWAVLREDRDALAGLGLGLLAWLRPEGALAGLVWVGFRLVDRRPVRQLATGWLLALVALFGWRWVTFGALLPNTAAAKFGGHDWSWVFERNGLYLKRDHLTWPVVAGVVAVGSLRDRRHLAVGLLAMALVAPAFTVELWMPGGRLLTPAYLLAAVLLGAHVARRPRAAAAIALFGAVASVALDERSRVQDRAHSVLPDNDVVEIARTIRARAPEGTVAAVRDAGLFAYELGPGITVYETHERALTRPHPGGANAPIDPPAQPGIVVVTQAREDATGVRYPSDAQVLERLDVAYEYAGRFHQHRHRYYDIYLRPSLGP